MRVCMALCKVELVAMTSAYTELPDKVAKGTAADIMAHLVELPTYVVQLTLRESAGFQAVSTIIQLKQVVYLIETKA